MSSCFLIILVLLRLQGLTDSQTIHVCTSGNKEHCNIDCETTDQTVPISFTHPEYGTAGACTAGGSCQSGLGLGYTVARVNSTFTRLTVPSLNCTTDRGNWTCSYGSTASTPVFLPCPSSFGNGIQISVSGKNVTCQLNCQSPISGFTSLQMHNIQDGNTSLLHNVTSISGSTPSAADGCSDDEQNIILTRDVSNSNICGSAKFQCIFTNIYLGTAKSSESAVVSLEGCQSSTVLSSTVQTSTPEPSPVCQPCLISDCLLLWQCILIWIVIGVAVIILISCCIFCLWKKRQNSEKKQSTKNNEMQNLKDKKRNNKAFDDKTENKDRTDTKSIDKPGYDNSGYDKSEYHKSGYHKSVSGYDKSGYDKSGYDKSGYHKSGYDKSGYDKSGYDMSGYDKSGYDKSGYDEFGYDKSGYDKSGYDKSGYDKFGYDKSGYDKSGYDKSGYDEFGYDEFGYDKFGNHKSGYDNSGNDKSGFDNYQFYHGDHM